MTAAINPNPTTPFTGQPASDDVVVDVDEPVMVDDVAEGGSEPEPVPAPAAPAPPAASDVDPTRQYLPAQVVESRGFSYPFCSYTFYPHHHDGASFTTYKGVKYPSEFLFSPQEQKSPIRGLMFKMQQPFSVPTPAYVLMALDSYAAANDLIHYFSTCGVEAVDETTGASRGKFGVVGAAIKVNLNYNMLPWWNAFVPYNRFTQDIRKVVLQFEEIYASCRDVEGARVRSEAERLLASAAVLEQSAAEKLEAVERLRELASKQTAEAQALREAANAKLASVESTSVAFRLSALNDD